MLRYENISNLKWNRFDSFQNIFKKPDEVTGDLHGTVKRKYVKPLRRRRSDRNSGHPLPAVVRQHWMSAHVALDRGILSVLFRFIVNLFLWIMDIETLDLEDFTQEDLRDIDLLEASIFEKVSRDCDLSERQDTDSEEDIQIPRKRRRIKWFRGRM